MPVLHGHYGYTDEVPFEQEMRDVIGFEVAHRTADIMKVVVARELTGRESLPSRTGSGLESRSR